MPGLERPSDATATDAAVPAGCCGAAGPAVVEICATAHQRLHELQPYLDEAVRLQAVLAAATSGRRSSAPAPSESPKRRPTGSNKRAILEHLAEHPDSSAVDVARDLGIERPVIASTMSRMARRGELQRTTRGFRIAFAA